ncbi:hypothetical protein C0992_006783 [Termitomyces sp. T32_za158]|nr:hypothetical protein C0992_006783 [Termitomyces sp. T32_za158]
MRRAIPATTPAPAPRTAFNATSLEAPLGGTVLVEESIAGAAEDVLVVVITDWEAGNDELADVEMEVDRGRMLVLDGTLEEDDARLEGGKGTLEEDEATLEEGKETLEEGEEKLEGGKETLEVTDLVAEELLVVENPVTLGELAEMLRGPRAHTSAIAA